jgi:aspartate/methionine/tyrosine aminotransferase
VPGITAGISYSADLFLDEGSTIITSSPCWDNYSLIFEERRGAKVHAASFFAKDVRAEDKNAGLNMAAIRSAIQAEAAKGVVRIILNFPNNPSGYSPTNDEARQLIGCLKEAADGGAAVLALCDDAYFGFLYEDNLNQESLFATLSSLHERILAIKLDGPIKEDYAWGFRTAFVTFGCLGLDDGHFDALIKKMMGAIRSSVSCSNTASQHLIIKISEDSRTAAEKDAYDKILFNRYCAVKKFILAHPGHKVLRPLPFNSGYFMCFHCEGISAETLRQKLLDEHGIGLVSLDGEYLRLAFSSLDDDKIEQTCQRIYQCASPSA